MLGSAFQLAACGPAPTASSRPPLFVRVGSSLRIPVDSPLRKRLVVAPVELHRAPHWLDFPATVAADATRIAKVLPALGGRVTALDVNVGDHVERGQLLAVIESGDMAQAYADLVKARDTLKLARETRARERGVAQVGGAAVKDLQAAHSAVVQAAADYGRAQTRVRALGGNPDAATARPIEVRAPIAGIVTALSITPGMYVNDPTASIMTLINIDRVWVDAQVPSDALGRVAVGQRVEIQVPAWPQRVFHGRVSTIAAELDPDTRRDTVRIAMKNADHALRPNMFANVRLAVEQAPEVFVPASALLMNNDHTTVFVEIAPWTFVRRTVTLSYDGSAEARVFSGLKAGDRVVVAGAVLLNDD
ncbi:MAG TPA: efflux RND transporter periplasmic adaptor subunit [Nevskiaceae bacterium]|nr:efflux RND transporter periplasmic adaptor subunit [Nevskiaceae bacterium]